MKQWECKNGKVYELPDNHCIFCTHCTDVLYDYTNGPYGFACELEHEYIGCEDFESDGYVFDEEDYLRRRKEEEDIRKAFEELKKNPEIKKMMDAMTEEIWRAILYGEEREEKKYEKDISSCRYAE